MDVELYKVESIDLQFNPNKDFEEVLTSKAEDPLRIAFLNGEGHVIAALDCVEDGPDRGYQDQDGHYYQHLPKWLGELVDLKKAKMLEALQS